MLEPIFTTAPAASKIELALITLKNVSKINILHHLAKSVVQHLIKVVIKDVTIEHNIASKLPGLGTSMLSPGLAMTEMQRSREDEHPLHRITSSAVMLN